MLDPPGAQQRKRNGTRRHNLSGDAGDAANGGRAGARGRMRSKLPTLSDVAQLAGVSVATASKALSGQADIAGATRARVVEIAEEIGYRSNVLAANLLRGRSFTVGLITNDSTGRIALPVLLAAEDTLELGKIAVLLCDGRDSLERERHHLETLLTRRVDGIIVTGRRDPRPPIASDLPVPIVYAMTESTDPHDVSVLPDDEAGGRAAVEHLLACGRRRIAHITGPRALRVVRLRARGARRALTKAGLSFAGPRVFYGEWSEAFGRHALQELFTASPDFDAVFCGSDQIARGVVDALRAQGRRVPEDVAVVGFDNWDVIARACEPPLTTVDMNLSGIGRRAAELLLAAIEGKVEPGPHLVPCELVVRDSTPRR